MVVLRPRKEVSGSPSNALAKNLESEPVSPDKVHELSERRRSLDPSGALEGSGVILRRSLRFAPNLNLNRDRGTSDSNSPGRNSCKGFIEEGDFCSEKADTVSVGTCGGLATEGGRDSNAQDVGVFEAKKVEELQGKLMGVDELGPGVEQGVKDDHSEMESSSRLIREASHAAIIVKGKRKLKNDGDMEPREEPESAGACLNLRSGVKIARRPRAIKTCNSNCYYGSEELKMERTLDDSASLSPVAMNAEGTPDVGNDGIGSIKERQGVTRDDRNKAVLIDESPKDVAAKELTEESAINEDGHFKSGRFSMQPKAKGKLDETPLESNGNTIDLNVVPIVNDSIDHTPTASHPEDAAALQQEQRALETTNARERFRQVARINASRFAHFAREEEENNYSSEANTEAPSLDAEQEIEDWPGPFSTAMKIIKDRAINMDAQRMSSSDKRDSVPLIWHPQDHNGSQNSKVDVPTLQELCIAILAKNAEAIASLECVPDELRNRLSQRLCDSRRMNDCFLELLFSGSPTDVRLMDCSWLSEEQFTRAFRGCDTQRLTVLQLDQCGRCLPDYILHTTLAQSSHCLPAMTNISLKGAYRLSDDGLRALSCAAPQLKSINLSQCSFLTSTCIDILAETLGSVLTELFIDDCQNIDAMCLLPALNRLEHLEVLSVAGIQNVCDDFIQNFIAIRGQNMKQLNLGDCVKVTDSSLKVIAGTCSALCALDLANLSKLTDSAIGYIANGCSAIQNLKLRRNAFSDEAVAAFLETRGASLVELSLNNVKKVGNNTAIALAKHSQKLVSLDLSWCRNLTDDAMGLIVDSCESLKVLKLFGCTQITDYFIDGHSNTQLQIIGSKKVSILENVWER